MGNIVRDIAVYVASCLVAIVIASMLIGTPFSFTLTIDGVVHEYILQMKVTK